MQARAVSFCALDSIPFIGYDSQYQHSKHRASTIVARAEVYRWPVRTPCVPPVRSRRLPSAIYFETDLAARTAVTQCGRIQHASFESLDSEQPDRRDGLRAGRSGALRRAPEELARSQRARDCALRPALSRYPPGRLGLRLPSRATLPPRCWSAPSTTPSITCTWC